jgi:hypothetical protein
VDNKNKLISKIRVIRKEAWDDLHSKEEWAKKDEVIKWIDKIIESI